MRKLRRERHFDHYSEDVWKELFVTHSRKSEDRQCQASFRVFAYVKDVIEEITRAAMTTHSSYKTKRNALVTLRRIGKSLCMSSESALGDQVLQQFSETTILEDSMRSITLRMTNAERRSLCNVAAASDGGTFFEALKELMALADDECVFGKLLDVLALLEQALEENAEEKQEVDFDGIGEDDEQTDSEGNSEDDEQMDSDGDSENR